MIAELGHFSLILSFICCILAVCIAQIGLIYGHPHLQTIAPRISLINCFLLLFSFACLIYSYISSDFSVINVWQNSHDTKPLMYKISGAWSNHEGSLLLWLSIFGVINYLIGYHTSQSHLPYTIKIQTLIIQHILMGGFIIFVLLTSNPFGRILPVPLEGRGLNPILQDPALAIHPPLLYIGYVLTSVNFSIALSYLLWNNTNINLGLCIRNWTICAWFFLTLGISMGSWWAYYELGWGGFWFWDPVENASLMPWLVMTALLHSVMVAEKRDTLKAWTTTLSILGFLLSLLGTFLVRSGILTSVHAFSVDPERGIFILALISFYSLAALLILSLRIHTLKSVYIFSPLSKEGAIIINNYFMLLFLSIITLGTLYPLFAEVFSGIRISVGAPFFNLAFIPFVIPLLILMPLAPLLNWRKANFHILLQKVIFLIAACLFVFLLLIIFTQANAIPISLGLTLGLWLIGGSLIAIKKKIFPLQKFFLNPWQHLSQLGGIIAHIGVGILSIGIVCTSFMSQEKIVTLTPNSSVPLSGYTVQFKTMKNQKIANYLEEAAFFNILDDQNNVIAELMASKRLYDKPKIITTEAAFMTSFWGNYYITLHEKVADNAYNFRLYYHAFVNFIWLGSVIMACGGIMTLLRRKKHVHTNAPNI